MNEEALQDSFKIFSSQGYNGSIEDYKQLISSNEEALQDSFKMFSEGGYNGSIEDYSTLIGVSKKKVDSTLEPEDTVSTTEVETTPGSLDSSEEIIIPNAPKRNGTVFLENQNDEESTHLMAAEQLEDGNWVGFPRLFQNEDGTWVDDFVKGKWEDAYNEAKSRGEVVDFGKDSKSALAYGEGSWKDSYNKNKGKKLLSDGFDPSTLTAPLEDGSIPDPLKTEAKVLSKLEIDPIEFNNWKEKNLRAESKRYKFFKQMLLNNEGEQYEDEQKIQKQITAFLAQKLKKNLEAIDAADEESRKVLIEENRKDAQTIINNLKAYKKETITDDLESRKKLLKRQRAGGIKMAASTGFEMIKAAGNAAANFAMGTGAALFTEADALLNATGADKKGALLGISEMFLDAAEAYNLDAGETQRSTFVQGKEVISNGKTYIVSDEGTVYDEETHIKVDDILSESEVSSIKNKASKIKGDSTSFDMGSGLTGLTSTLVNLFGLIRGGQKLQKSIGVSPKVGMGIMSFSSTVASSVQSVKEDLMAQGVSEKEATNKALIFGSGIATLDGVFSSLAGGNEKLLGSTKVVKDLLMDLAKTKGKEFSTQQLKRKVRDLIKENAKELFIEEIPVLLSERGINNAINYSVGMDVRAGVEDLKRADFMETAFLTLGATTGMGSTRLITSNQRNDVVRYLSSNVKDVDIVSAKLVTDGLLTQEEADKTVSEIKSMQYAENKVSGAVKTTENMIEAAALIEKKEKLISERENTDPSLRSDIDKRIDSIDQQLEQLKEKDNQDVQDIINGEKDGDIKIEVTREEAVEALRAENEANKKLGLPTIIESEENILKTQDKLMKEKQGAIEKTKSEKDLTEDSEKTEVEKTEQKVKKDESEQTVSEINETKKFQDNDVVLKEETFTITDEDGGKQEVTVKTYLDGSLSKADSVSFDADGNQIRRKRVKLADNDVVVRDGLTAQEQVEFVYAGDGYVMEKTSERSGNKVNNPKKIAQLTTEQKQNLGIETETQEVASPIQDNLQDEDLGVSKLSQEFKSDKPSMEEVYNKAEDLGIPLKKAREYIEEIGYTEQEIKDFVFKREDMSVKRDVAGEKNIFVKGKNITLNFLDTIKRKAASAKSYMPKNAFIAKETKNAHIQAEVKVAERMARRLKKMLKGQPDSVYNEVNKLMRGEEANLPIKISLIATAMRNHIDSLSEKLVMSGAVESEAAAANIMSNIGEYMNRSYRLFDDKNYADNISEEVILEAKEFLKAQELNRITKEAAKENITPQEYVNKQEGGKNFTVGQYVDAKADQSVRDIIKKNEVNAFVSAVVNEAKKDTKILKERKEIPAEIRALMGEYTDAAYNYVMSVGKIKAIIETQKYLDKLKDIGDGVFLFKKGDIRRPAEYVEISAETNKTLEPLNGYYAPKELVDQMNSGPLNVRGLGEGFQKAFEVYMKAVGAVKYSKTILSVGTHAKNVLGNAYFMAQNGYFNPKDYNEAFKVLKNEFNNLDNEQLNKKLDEYIKAGIINQGVSLREVQGLLEGEQDFDVTIEKRTAKRSENIIKKGAKNLGKKLEDAYQAEDDLFKIVAYENEKRDYAKIEFDKDYNDLTEKEKSKVDSKVAEIVKNILPNYSRLGNISKGLRVLPVATFISFQLEAYRTAFNTVDLALKEVKSENPRERKKGAKRLTSLIGFQALKYATLGMLGNALLGDDDEDEEESKAQEVLEGAIGISKPKRSVMDARPFLPFWSQNSDILITKAGDGKFSYIDMSASDPYGGLAKVVRAFQRGDNVKDSVLDAGMELLNPIFSPDILAGAINTIIQNRDVYGKKVFEETDSADESAIKIIDVLYKTFEPGTLTSLRKIAGMDTPGKAYTDYGRYVTKMMKKENRVAEIIGQITGFKKNDVDVKMQMSYKLGDLKEKMKPIEIKQYIAKKNIEKTGDAKEYVELLKSEHPDKYEIYKEASEIVKSAQKFGLTIEKIYPILKSKFRKGDDADIIFLFDQVIDQLIPKDE